MHRSERSRGVSFASLMGMLMVYCGFTLAKTLPLLSDTAQRPAGLITAGYALCFLVCAMAALMWKRWGMIGLAALGALGTLTFLIMGAWGALIMAMIALMAVLISVLTKEWFGME